MNRETETELIKDSLGQSTAPESFGISARGFASEEDARELATTIGQWIRGISIVLDLSRLDGVTVAHDYAQALAELDRGYKTNIELTPSEGHAVGVAMTPSVFRDGVLKSHIVFDAGIVAPILDPEHADFQLALHVIGHECAHVEVTFKFDQAFPGVLLRKQYADMREAHRWNTILACWDEYAATLRSGTLGHDPTEWYEETLLNQMRLAPDAVKTSIRAFKEHGRVDQLYNEACKSYGTLLKLAAYLQGTLDGRGHRVSERTGLSRALAGHWFEPYFHQLHDACRTVADNYGTWTDKKAFEAIGDIAEAVLASGGIVINNGRLYVDAT